MHIEQFVEIIHSLMFQLNLHEWDHISSTQHSMDNIVVKIAIHSSLSKYN